jgi:hypothetical protein
VRCDVFDAGISFSFRFLPNKKEVLLMNFLISYDWDDGQLRLSAATPLHSHIPGHQSPMAVDRKKDSGLIMIGSGVSCRTENHQNVRPWTEWKALFPIPLAHFKTFDQSG